MYFRTDFSWNICQQSHRYSSGAIIFSVRLCKMHVVHVPWPRGSPLDFYLALDRGTPAVAGWYHPAGLGPFGPSWAQTFWGVDASGYTRERLTSFTSPACGRIAEIMIKTKKKKRKRKKNPDIKKIQNTTCNKLTYLLKGPGLWEYLRCRQATTFMSKSSKFRKTW